MFYLYVFVNIALDSSRSSRRRALRTSISWVGWISGITKWYPSNFLLILKTTNFNFPLGNMSFPKASLIFQKSSVNLFKVGGILIFQIWLLFSNRIKSCRESLGTPHLDIITWIIDNLNAACIWLFIQNCDINK